MWENHLFQIAGATTDEKTRDFENYKEQRNKKTKDKTWKFEDQWRLRLLEYLLGRLEKCIYFICMYAYPLKIVSF